MIGLVQLDRRDADHLADNLIGPAVGKSSWATCF